MILKFNENVILPILSIRFPYTLKMYENYMICYIFSVYNIFIKHYTILYLCLSVKGFSLINKGLELFTAKENIFTLILYFTDRKLIY